LPIVKRAVSPVGLSISAQIKAFMKTNAAAMQAGATVDEGIDAVAQAIAYGIAKGFADPSIASAFASGGIVPPVGNPAAGTTLHSAIAAVTTEP